ncbi:MAG TPA: hypothetical protein DHU96_27990 [Actinobacteria bacterium]|nr:hypothetical protein [Actinomycetota bacterium]
MSRRDCLHRQIGRVTPCGVPGTGSSLGLFRDRRERWTRPGAGCRCARSPRRSGTARTTRPSPICTQRNTSTRSGTGLAARAEPIRCYHEAFSGLRIEVEELIAGGGTVVLRAAFRGTGTGGYAGRAATGRAVDGPRRAAGRGSGAAG